MRKLIFMLIACIFLTVSCAIAPLQKIPATKTEIKKTGYTYESLIDPAVIMTTWKKVRGSRIDENGFIIYFINPDRESKIPVASMIIHSTGYLTAYAYLYNGKPYVFVWDGEGCYKQFEIINEKAKEQLKQNLLNALDGASI